MGSVCAHYILLLYLVDFIENKRTPGTGTVLALGDLHSPLSFDCRSGLEKCDPVRLWKGRWCGVVCGPDEADPAAGGKRGTRFDVAFEYVCFRT